MKIISLKNQQRTKFTNKGTNRNRPDEFQVSVYEYYSPPIFPASLFLRTCLAEFSLSCSYYHLGFPAQTPRRESIPPEKQKAVFNRFVQAETDYSRSFEGSGLGLSIAKNYTEMLGGKIWVDSEPGKSKSPIRKFL